MRLVGRLVACLRLVGLLHHDWSRRLVGVVGGRRLVRRLRVGWLHHWIWGVVRLLRRLRLLGQLVRLRYMVHRLRHYWPPGVGRGCRGKGLVRQLGHLAATGAWSQVICWYSGVSLYTGVLEEKGGGVTWR